MPSACLLAEFDIWYNESFFIPEDLQVALKPGGSIRPGMVPVSRIMSLVSGTRAGVGLMDEHGVVSAQRPSSSLFSANMAVYRLLLASPMVDPGKQTGIGLSPGIEKMRTQETSLAAVTSLGRLILPRRQLQSVWQTWGWGS